MPPRVADGCRKSVCTPDTSTATTTPDNGVLQGGLFVPLIDAVIVSLAVEVTGAASAGGVFRRAGSKSASR